MSNNETTEMVLAAPKRRSFLKFLMIGGGVAIAGSVLNSLKLNTNNSSITQKDKLFSKFHITENNKEISFRTKEGEELLIIEKTS